MGGSRVKKRLPQVEFLMAVRMSKETAAALFGKEKTPAEAAQARQLVRSENDRWKELSLLRVEVNKLRAELRVLEQEVRSYFGK